MTSSPTSEIEELLGAYALDAVDPDERDVVEAHLPSAPAAGPRWPSYREVAALLANSGTAAPEACGTASPKPSTTRRRRCASTSPAAGVRRLGADRAVGGGHRRDPPAGLAGARPPLTRTTGSRSRSQRRTPTAAAVNEANLALLEPNSHVVRLSGTGDERALAVLTDGRHRATCWRSISRTVTAASTSSGGPTANWWPHGARLDGASPACREVRCGRRCRKLLMTAEPAYVEQPTTAPIMQGAVV